MATETAAYQGFHDDFDLDIDLALGDDGNTLSVAQNSTVDVQDPLSAKDAGTGLVPEAPALAITERAPSEINYDSEPEVEEVAPVDKTPTDHAEDEITWDDADEEASLMPQELVPQAEIGNIDMTEGSLPKDLGQNGVESLDEAAMEEHDAGEAEFQDLDYSLGAETYNDIQSSFHAQHADDTAPQDLVDDGESHNNGVEASDQEGYDSKAEDTGDGDDDEAVNEEVDQMSPDMQNEVISYDLDVPYIVARFRAQDYSLFRTPDVDVEYLLDDTKVFRTSISEFLASLRKALQADLNEGDELVILVEDLCLEIQPIMVSAMKSVSISDFVNLHAKLVSNDQDDEEEENPPLRLTILARPTFTSRYQELLDGVSQGIGLSQLRRDFDTGRGDEQYHSPYKNEEEFEEYDDEMGYEELAPVSGEGAREISPDGQGREYQFSHEQHPDQEVDDDYSGIDQYGHQEDDETNSADYDQNDGYYDGNGEYGDEEYPEELDQEPQQSPGDALHEYEEAAVREQEPEGRAALHEATGPGAIISVVIPRAGVTQEDDIIDYADDENTKSKPQQQQANTQSEEQPDAPVLGEDTSPSATMDGDDDHDLGEIDYDLGFADNGEAGAEVDEVGGVSFRPAVDEITWEEDDAEGGVALLPMSLEPSASSVHGKRLRSGEEDESVEGSGAVDNKRRRSS